MQGTDFMTAQKQDGIASVGCEPVITEVGLTSAEVAERVKAGKVNGEQNVKTKSVGRIIFTNTVTFFNIIFVVISIILAFFVPKGIEGLTNYGFLVVVVVNMFIGIFQELKAKRTIDKLSLLSAPKVVAIRDGTEVNIALKDIVTDDVIALSSGSQICADAVVVSGSLEVNEALITGESDPIKKEVGDTVLSGSYVISGNAMSKVIHVGAENYAAKITLGAKKEKARVSEIANSLGKFIKVMSFIIVPIGVALFCVKYFLQQNELAPTVVTVLGTVIGMIPSGLVALTSAVFCVSVVRLARRNTLAQDLYCSETLARVDVLCLDKTGTITEGKMEVAEVVAKGASEAEIAAYLKSLTLSICDTNPTAEAVRDYTSGVIGEVAVSTDVVPFSSARKWSGANFDGYSLLMGASEFLFGDLPTELKAEIEGHSADGMRVIAVAKSKTPIVDDALPEGLTLEGLILITDKIRKEAPDTLRYFAEQGVAIKIISGDNPVTVKSVAQRAGLENAGSYIDARELRTEEDIEDAVEKYTVFGRVTPDQKLAIVKALKKKGHTVGMTGDGVNDVLALREADCSIAVACGSDASKNVSKLVLLDNNFASMPKVVAEGRRCINNLQRSASLFLIKTLYNCCFAVLFMILSADLPFEPKNLTFVGYITIGPPAFILALEPNNEIVKGRFMPTVIRRAVPAALTVVLAVLAVYLAAPAVDVTAEQLSTVAVIVTICAGLMFLVKICIPFTKIRIAMFAVLIAFAVACFLIPFARDMFGLTSEYNMDMLLLAGPTVVGSAIVFALSDIAIGKIDFAKIGAKIKKAVQKRNGVNK